MRDVRPNQIIRRRGVVGLLLALTTMLLLLLPVLEFPQESKAQEQPDLFIAETDISFSRLDVVAGESFTVYACVHNIGAGSGTAVVKLYLRLEGSPSGWNYSSGDEANATVMPGGSSVVSFSLTRSAGAYEILVDVAEVDPDDANPSNNNATNTIKVFPSAELVSFESPTLILEPVDATIQGGTERVIPLSISAVGGDAKGVTIVVLDSAGVFVEPAHSPIDIDEGETGKVFIRISAPELDGETGTSEKSLLIQAVGENAAGNSAVVILLIHPPVTSTSWWTPTTTTATIIGLLAAALAAINTFEWGRYKFLGIFLPLYTKLKKEDVMNQYTRGKIHGYIVANPGDYFSSIGKALKISDGNLAYHLRVLEREGELVSRMDGIYKRFYPRGAKIEDSTENELSAVQRAIYSAIEETPGIIQREIASLLGVTSPTVSYHLRKLVSRGLVKARRKGMSMRYFVNDEKAGALH